MKRIVFFTAILIALMVIFSLLGSIYQLWHKQDVLYTTARHLTNVKKEHQQLVKQLKVVKTNQFIEEQARNNLFLAKLGEHQVIIAGSLSIQKQKMNFKRENIPNWQQWIMIFF
jgi:hypothetical protein